MICRIFDIQGGIELYDEVIKRLGEEEKPEGVHAHIAGKTDGGFQVIEVWDSIDHSDRHMSQGTGQAIEEVMQAAGASAPAVTDLEVHEMKWLG